MIRPRHKYVLVEKLDQRPDEVHNLVYRVKLSYRGRPEVWFGKVLAKGPEADQTTVGGTVMMPISLDPLTANLVLIPEDEILGDVVIE